MNELLQNAEYRWVTNGNVQLTLECRGRGKIPLLFAHGWISSRRMWYECVARLDPERYRMYLLDVRGCGRSDRPAEGHDLQGYTSDLAAALRAIGAPTLIIGHSMGGRLAQRLAVETPQDLAGLVLVAPATAQGTPVVARQRQLAESAFGSRRRIAVFQRGVMRAEIGEEAAERLIEDALLAQREHWFGWYDVGRVEDFSALVGRISVPTTVLIGQDDPLLPIGRAHREVVERIHQARPVVLNNCGHNIPLEAPQPVVEAIENLAFQVYG